MGTAERRGAPENGASRGTAVRTPEEPDRDIPVSGSGATDRRGIVTDTEEAGDQDSTVGADPLAATHEGVRQGAAMREETVVRTGAVGTDGERGTGQERVAYRPLWVEEPARRRRMPDPVRTSAVRAVLVIAVTLIQAMVAFLSTLAGSWLAFPMVISSVFSTVMATWGVLDVWVTRQVWNQRNGVVSIPSSTARSLRRERRRARRQARTAERAQERIRRQGGTGQLSHS